MEPKRALRSALRIASSRGERTTRDRSYAPGVHFSPGVEIARGRAGSGARSPAGCFATARASGGVPPARSDECRLCEVADRRTADPAVAPSADRPRPRAQVGASYARSTRRDESHGGANANEGRRARRRCRPGIATRPATRRPVLRERDADDDERRQADRGDRPHPVATCVDGEVCRRAERAGSQERASCTPADGDEEQQRPPSDHEQEADDARSRSSASSSSGVGAHAVSRRSFRGRDTRRPSRTAADPRERVTLELVPGHPPEVVAVRAERPKWLDADASRSTFLNSSQRFASRAPGGRPTQRSCRHRPVRRYADETEDDPPRRNPAPRSKREAAGRRAHIRDRRVTPMPARTSVTCRHARTASSNACPSVRYGSVSGSAANAREHGDDSRRHEQPQARCPRRRTRRSLTPRARRRRPCSVSPARGTPSRRAAQRERADRRVELAVGRERDSRP